jgi:hypothetical protein
MCRYAFSGPYKIHFTCFECRKAFKQPSLEDWMKLQGYGFALKQLWRAATYPPGRREELESQFGVTLVELESRYHEAAFKCPECKHPMANLGRDFKAPRNSDIRAWKAIQKVYRLGHAFQTCGCDGPGFIPASELEYQDYLKLMRETYLNHAKNYLANLRTNSEDRKAAANYWRTRVAAIKFAMKRELA